VHHLLVIVASTRPGRVGPRIGGWFAGRAAAHGAFEVTVADLAELALPLLDEPEHPSDRRYTREHTRRWSALVERADAVVIVTPEYNYGMPASLKNALDYLYHEWAYKPVGFVSYGMTSGGLRAVQMAKQVVTTLRMMPAGEAVTVFLRRQLDASGDLIVDGSLNAAAAALLDELAVLTGALAALRAPAPSR
jgi:NAD(P)H-dependent FMN reductase